jgi:preprotein translocase subunit SecB
MAEEANNNQKNPFEIKKIFLKDVSFESPVSPEVFVQQYKPALTVDFGLDTKKVDVDEDTYCSTVRVTATCKDAEDEKKTYFVCEVKYAGVFTVRMDDINLRHALEAVAPTILFPYASERVSSMTADGGFPPVILPPVNFELLFDQKIRQEQEQLAKDAAAGSEAPAPANN